MQRVVPLRIHQYQHSTSDVRTSCKPILLQSAGKKLLLVSFYIYCTLYDFEKLKKVLLINWKISLEKKFWSI